MRVKACLLKAVDTCRIVAPVKLSRWPTRLLAGSTAATPPGRRQRGGIGSAACLTVITTLGRRRDLDFFLLRKVAAAVRREAWQPNKST